MLRLLYMTLLVESELSELLELEFTELGLDSELVLGELVLSELCELELSLEAELALDSELDSELGLELEDEDELD
jgi:hypothetical protein